MKKTESRQATEREITTANAWAEQYCADLPDSFEADDVRRAEYEQALEILIFANGGQASEVPATWTVPKVEHDENRDVTPYIKGQWIYRAAGQSDVEHTRFYARQLLAAADELERRQAEAEVSA